MTELVGLAAVAVVAWFAAGTIFNIRTGRTLMQWMQEGLPMLGERTTVRWLGSTAVEMVIRDAKAPFTAITLVIFFEARDLPWMWAIGRARGRRDTLIVRGMLRRLPVIEFDALEPASWSGHEALPRVPRAWLQRTGSGAIIVHYESAEALAAAEALLAMADGAGLAVKRLAVRRTEPNLQLHLALPDRKQPARDFFAAVHAIAEHLGVS